MTDTNPAAKSRGLSLFLWISGGVLWILAGVMFYGMYLRDGANGRPTEQAGSSVASNPPAAEQPAGQQAPGGLVEPVAIWSEDGIADFSLTERSGKTVTKQDLLGKPWIVGFVFTRCAGPCPRVTGQMRKLQDQFKDQDVRLVTMTVDPDYDTPEILTRYAEAFDADKDRWLFLTGDKESLYRYIESEFKMPVEETTGADRMPGFEVIHTTNLLLVDAKGVVRGKYNAEIPEEMAKLRQDVKKLES